MVGQLQQLWKLQSIQTRVPAEKKRKREDEDSPPAKKSKKDSEDSLSEDDRTKLEGRIARFIKANIPLWEKILEYGVSNVAQSKRSLTSSQPLEVGELQNMLKKQDIKCSKEFLRDFMRKKVTFFTRWHFKVQSFYYCRALLGLIRARSHTRRQKTSKIQL